MKINKISIVVAGLFMTISITVSSQNLTQKQLEYEKNKVQIFTVKERDNLQLWFNEKVSLMHLSKDKEEQYSNILISYLAKMGRVDDKDKQRTKEEIIEKLDEILKKQDAEIKALLSVDEYKMHKKHYGDLLESIKNRIAETDY